MAAPHVCILQTSFAKREDTVAFLKEKVPGVRVEFITDSTLLTDVRANGGPSQAGIDRMTLYAKAAEFAALYGDLRAAGLHPVVVKGQLCSRLYPLQEIGLQGQIFIGICALCGNGI